MCLSDRITIPIPVSSDIDLGKPWHSVLCVLLVEVLQTQCRNLFAAPILFCINLFFFALLDDSTDSTTLSSNLCLFAEYAKKRDNSPR